MSKAPFTIDPVLTGITLAYGNTKLIADLVLPRVDPPLDKETFVYNVWTEAESYTVPDTKVGRKSAPNEVEFTAAEQTAKTDDYGLDDVVPYTDTANAGVSLDPRARAVVGLTDLILLDREIRVANLLFSTSSYASGLTSTLSGTSQWSDYTNSNPLDAILAAKDLCIIAPNTMTIGRQAWTKLRQHPKIVSGVLGNAGQVGAVTRQAVAELLELDNIFVGESFVNSAKKGQTASLARAWGKHCSLTYINPLAQGDKDKVTFGATFQFGTRISGSIPEPKIGLRGSERIRVGESVKEIIMASDTGYFFQNCVA